MTRKETLFLISYGYKDIEDPEYMGSKSINSSNIADYVHAYHACADFPQRSDLSTQTQALNLAIYYRSEKNLEKMTQYLSLAAMHYSRRDRIKGEKKSLDLSLQDPGFEFFYLGFGNSNFLGRLITETSSTAIYVPPQSMKDEDANALAHILKTKPEVKVLDVSHQHLTDRGAIALADALRDHPGVKTVYFTGNQINKEGIEALKACETALREKRPQDNFEFKLDGQRTKFTPRN